MCEACGDYLMGVLQTVAFLEMLGLPYNLDHKDSSQAPAGSASAGNIACPTMSLLLCEPGTHGITLQDVSIAMRTIVHSLRRQHCTLCMTCTLLNLGLQLECFRGIHFSLSTSTVSTSQPLYRRQIRDNTGQSGHCGGTRDVSGGTVYAGADSGAAAAAANAEEIDIDDVDDELEDADDGAGGAGDSATAQPMADESMFASVEIHNFDPTGGGMPERDDDSKAVPEAIANVFRQ